MAQKTLHTYFNEDSLLIGKFEKNPKNINFQTVNGVDIHDAILASVDIIQQYKLPVRLVIDDVNIDIPFVKKDKYSLSNIMREYTNKMSHKYR